MDERVSVGSPRTPVWLVSSAETDGHDLDTVGREPVRTVGSGDIKS